MAFSQAHTLVQLLDQHQIMTTIADTVRKTLKLRAKRLSEFLERLRRRSPPNLWRFGLAVREVIVARMLRAMTGKLSAAEVRRMFVEKQLATIHAHLAHTESILNGEAASAPAAYFDVYQRAVESNRKRLSNPRWRWLNLYHPAKRSHFVRLFFQRELNGKSGDRWNRSRLCALMVVPTFEVPNP